MKKKKKIKPDSPVLLIICLLMFAACILGFSAGCIFEDVDADERSAVYAIVGLCIAIYCGKQFFNFFSSEPEDRLTNE